MSSATLTYKAPGTLQLEGELNFSSISLLQSQASIYWQRQNIDTIDLSAVSRSNSAGLALLLEWQRLAEQNQHSLKFINMPTNMRAAAELYGVNKLLKLDRAEYGTSTN